MAHIRSLKRMALQTLFVCCAILLALPLHAQTTRAVLRGLVVDTTGGALPGVTVTVTAPNGSLERTVTDSEGRYAFEVTTSGTHAVEASLSGFGTYKGGVDLRPGEARDLDVTLAISPVVESVTVTRVVESGERVPQAVTVIQGDAIQAFQRRASPAEAFAGTPGLYVENRRNYSLSGGVRFAIRAPLPRFGMRGVQILQDGVPMTMADGTTEPTNIDLASLGKVEVLRGPSSVLYGNSAAGVITLESEFAQTSPLALQGDVQFGSFGYDQQGVKASGTSGRVSYLVSGNRLQTNGFRQHSRSEVSRGNIVVRTVISPQTDLRAVVNIYDLPLGESASTVTLADARTNPRGVRPQAFTQGWGESTGQQQGGLTLRHAFRHGGTFRTTLWGVRRTVWNPIPGAIVDLGRRAGGARSEYTGTFAMGSVPVTLATGFDLSLQRDDRTEFVNLGVPAGGDRAVQGAARLQQDEAVTSASPFALLSVRLGERWNVSAGARYDRYRFTATDRFLSNGDQSGGRTLSAASPMAGITYVPNGWLNLYGNVATAYQTPTTVELSNRADFLGGFNNELGPETLRSVEVGARGAILPLRARFEVATYRSRISNALVRFTRPDEQAYFRNAGRTNRNGVEALLEWLPTSRLKARVAYTYQDFSFDRFVAPEGDFTGKIEPGAPPHQVVVAGSYLARVGLFTSAQYRFLDAYPVNSTNTIENWAYQVVDLRVGLDRRWSGMRLRPFVAFDNIFNERYNSSAIVNSLGDRFFEPAPGREFSIGLTIGSGSF